MADTTATVHAPATGGGILDAERFRHDAAGTRSDAATLEAAIEACRGRVGVTLRLAPRKTYALDDPAWENRPAVALTDHEDLTIDGNGARLLCHHVRNALRLQRCRRVCVRNLTIDWDFPLASPGVVERQRDGRLVIHVDDAWPLGEKNLAMAVTQYDPQRNDWVMDPAETYYPRDVRRVGPQLIASPAFGEPHHPPDGSKRLADGMHVVVRHYVYHAAGVEFGGRGNEDITFQDVTLHQCPGHAFAGYGGDRGFRLSRVRIARRPGALVSAAADGCHFGGIAGDVIIEDCDFSGMGDDSVNIHGTWLEILEAPTGKELVLTSRWLSASLRLEPGDELALCRKANLRPYGLVRVGNSEIDLDRGVARVRVTGDADEPVALGDFVANVTRSSSRFCIRNNYFHDHRARGMLLQARDGLVEDNRVERVMAAAVQMTTDCNHWKEGFGCENVVIRRNRFVGCNYAGWERGPTGRHMAAVNLLVDTPTGLGDWPVHHNITLTDNVIEDTPGLAILVASARNVRVSNNRIIRSNTAPFDGTGRDIDAAARGAIMVTRAADVRVTGNRVRPATGMSRDGAVHVDTRNTRDVVVSDNVITQGEPDRES